MSGGVPFSLLAAIATNDIKLSAKVSLELIKYLWLTEKSSKNYIAKFFITLYESAKY